MNTNHELTIRKFVEEFFENNKKGFVILEEPYEDQFFVDELIEQIINKTDFNKYETVLAIQTLEEFMLCERIEQKKLRRQKLSESFQSHL